ncbi:Probable Zn dependent nucleoside deaminase [Acholeplasma oculi]|uniref:tRNA-specific adenosine deaminase n=2 Tax=Acholeplasma oculi TaxID=35623 RepID=A0A061AIK0_9MOLU|nr:tRNA adenosine(34) deaminase TadA [Acholeplasma oculi]CDR31456.1 Probable Zn dependent nucleoside deaminase [Acholeplasma oculi]
MKNKDHNYFMNEALKEAKKAFLKDEVPVGAIAVKHGKIIARAHNLRESKQDFSAHAEFIVMQKAQKKLGSWRLEDVSIYVTLEPCPMCAGAMIQSRIKDLYFGAKDPKAGAVCSVLKLLDNPFNHQIHYEGDILFESASELLKDFFKKLRS